MSQFLFQASWQMVGLLFIVWCLGLFTLYLLSGNKVKGMKLDGKLALSLVLGVVASLFFRIPGGLFIVIFLMAMGADKYIIPKLQQTFKA